MLRGKARRGMREVESLCEAEMRGEEHEARTSLEGKWITLDGSRGAKCSIPRRLLVVEL